MAEIENENDLNWLYEMNGFERAYHEFDYDDLIKWVDNLIKSNANDLLKKLTEENDHESIFFLKVEMDEVLHRLKQVTYLLKEKIETNKNAISKGVNQTNYTFLNAEINAWNDVLFILENNDLKQ